MMLHFCRQMGEQNRVVMGARALLRRLRLAQSYFRAFLARRALWCERATVVWEKVEDGYLEKSVGLASQLRAQQVQKQASVTWGGRRGTVAQQPNQRSWIEDVESIVAKASNWRTFRIPAQERKAAMGRWYIARVREMVAGEHQWNLLIQAVSTSHGDLRKWIDTATRTDDAGANSKAMAELETERFNALAQRSRVSDYVGFGDQEALDLIKATALKLRDDPDMLHLQNHPASKEARRRPSLRATISGAKVAARRFGAQPQRNVVPQNRPKAEPAKEPKEPKRVDVEDLFRKFSPRHWEPPPQDIMQEEEEASPVEVLATSALAGL